MTERSGRPVVIAHRGASGYLPEHTLEAKALAYGLGADYLEQDLVASQDDELVVLHDIHLDRVTDAAERFPRRARADGRWYARDFTLAELRTLRVTERLDEQRRAANYPGRFPAGSGSFRVNTLAEEIALVRGLNASTGRRVGLYPELKRPAWHRQEGVDLAALLLSSLTDAGVTPDSEPVWIQCFDAAELRERIVEEDVTFAEAADEYSIGPGVGEGGDLGWLAVAELAADWQEAVVDLEEGGVSPVFAMDGQPALILLKERKEGESELQMDKTLRDQIYEELREEKFQAVLEEYIDTVRTQALIQYKSEY